MKRKGLKVRLLSILVSVILGFNCAFIPSVQVQANPAIVITELLKYLLVTTGLVGAGYASQTQFDGLTMEQKNDLLNVLLEQVTGFDGLAHILDKANEIDRTGTLQEDLEALDDGDALEYDEFVISKEAVDNYKLTLRKEAIEQATAAIQAWAESDDNSYIGSSDTGFQDVCSSLSYYSSDKSLAYDSLDVISDRYSSAIVDMFADAGFDDSNSWVIQLSPYGMDNFVTLTGGTELLYSSPYMLFFCIPFGYSYVNNCRFSSSDYYYHSFTVYDSDNLIKAYSYYYDYGYGNDTTICNEHILSVLPCVVYYPSADVYEFREIALSETLNYTNWYMKANGYFYLYNYDDAFVNNSYYLDSYYYSSNGYTASIYSNSITKNYLTDAGVVDMSAVDDVSMDFTTDTAAELAAYTDIAELVAYTESLSAELAALKEAVIDADNVNTENIIKSLQVQTNSLVEGMQTQTKSLLDGIGDTITDALKALFVPSDAVVADTVYSLTSKFEFMNDLKAAGVDIKDALFGITPSPYLKIYIMPITKSKYGDWGMGEYILIDISWYADFKELGDAIIGTFLWAFFLWRLFLKLPSILNGLGADTYISLPSASSSHLGLPLHQSLLEDKSSKGARK